MRPRWSISRRLRNRAMHALHGNGPRRDGQWNSTPFRNSEPRFLQEPQPANSLRAAGWTLPPPHPR